jgi:DNA-directed RNA polymerase subunit RPC12/RpoP
MEHLYTCPTCKKQKKKFEHILSMSPSEHRLATGQSIRCPRCGDILCYKGEKK